MLWSDPEQAESSKGAMTLWGACGRVPDPQYKRSSEQPCSVLPSAPGRQWHWPRLAGGPPRLSSTDAASRMLLHTGDGTVTGLESGLRSECKTSLAQLPPAGYTCIGMHGLRKLLYKRKKKYKAS